MLIFEESKQTSAEAAGSHNRVITVVSDRKLAHHLREEVNSVKWVMAENQYLEQGYYTNW